MAAPKEKAKVDEPGMWTVFDLNARRRDVHNVQIRRSHTSRIGNHFMLCEEEGTKMPEADARTFLIDGFRVLNEEGDEVRNVPEGAMQTPGAVPLLREGQTIAEYDELTHEALRARAARKPGGERFKKNTPAQTIISFLMGEIEEEQPKKGRGRVKEGPSLTDAETEEMSGQEVDKMFEGS